MNKNMRAQFINEKFTDKTDPIRDMGIGMKYPQVLLETAIDLFGDKPMFFKMSLKKGKQYQLKGIPPYYELENTLHLSREEWSQLRKAIGKPIKREYVHKMRVPFEGRNINTLKIATLLDEIYNGDFLFAEDGPIVDIINDDKVIMRMKPGCTYRQFYNEIKRIYGR